MLRIRPELIRNLEAVVDEELIERLADFLQEEVPGAVEINRSDLKLIVEDQVGKARGYGLESQQQIAMYVLTAGLLGEEFDSKFPAAAAMLTAPNLSPDEKADWLAEWTETLFRTLEQGEGF